MADKDKSIFPHHLRAKVTFVHCHLSLEDEGDVPDYLRARGSEIMCGRQKQDNISMRGNVDIKGSTYVLSSVLSSAQGDIQRLSPASCSMPYLAIDSVQRPGPAYRVQRAGV